ncbi:MAG TPA: hypothetical protein VHH32_06545 [Gemmatimonadales bacterium]|jgi:hypothetical protein|nr:hypothetical protein [Gemmatimonadales bacterium]
MTFKSRIWYPITGVLSMINLAAVGYAAASAEPWHATVHAALAVAFGLGASRLRQQRPGGMDQLGRLEALEADMTALQQELSEAQERLDFTERVLAQRAEARQVGPER